MMRLHYAYPADFPYDVLDAMARHKNVCRYLDIALQHIDDKVLANMRRHITADETRALLARIREAVPGIAIRTTLMVGFPGEDDGAFERLMDFVREQRFERMGALRLLRGRRHLRGQEFCRRHTAGRQGRTPVAPDGPPAGDCL